MTSSYKKSQKKRPLDACHVSLKKKRKGITQKKNKNKRQKLYYVVVV